MIVRLNVVRTRRHLRGIVNHLGIFCALVTVQTYIAALLADESIRRHAFRRTWKLRIVGIMLFPRKFKTRVIFTARSRDSGKLPSNDSPSEVTVSACTVDYVKLRAGRGIVLSMCATAGEIFSTQHRAKWVNLSIYLGAFLISRSCKAIKFFCNNVFRERLLACLLAILPSPVDVL